VGSRQLSSGAISAEVPGEKRGDKLAAGAEIPRQQRRKSAPPLARLAAMPNHNIAIVQAFVTGCYGMTEIVQAFEIHYATVSRIVKMTDNFWEKGDLVYSKCRAVKQYLLD
jgi:hypothetical protein